jgi:hypothetical protein
MELEDIYGIYGLARLKRAKVELIYFPCRRLGLVGRGSLGQIGADLLPLESIESQ